MGDTIYGGKPVGWYSNSNETQGHASSSQWPEWVCKNSCKDGSTYPADTKVERCPHCGGPLVRWRDFQERR